MRDVRRTTMAATVSLLAAIALAGCGSGDSGAKPDAAKKDAAQCRKLDSNVAWYGDVREKLQAAIDAHSSCTGTFSGSPAPVAIFDWDNTVVKNDIGYGTNYWMIRNDKILQPANQDWKTTDRYMTDAAAAALKTACGTDVPAGQPLRTSSSTNTACADEILAILDDKTRAGEPAFAGYDARRLIGSYSWGTALSAGYTAAQLAEFAAAAKKENLGAAEGTTQTVGSQQVDGYIRVYPQIKDLIGTLRANGVDTWIVSASPEPIVKVWASDVGIDDNHVVGVRSVYENGKQTAHLLGCGDVADGDDSVMTYVDGKRCWANQAIFGVRGAAAFQQLPAQRRQILAAGDSVTDVTFVGDATAVHLVINRNKPELMCRAYDNADGKWLINPMFIAPNKQVADPYPCSTKAFTKSDGSSAPLLRDDGGVVQDQKDTVF
jgi:phosphoglycolate phosphatase-like HAD superfamily hydrolase